MAFLVGFKGAAAHIGVNPITLKRWQKETGLEIPFIKGRPGAAFRVPELLLEFWYYQVCDYKRNTATQMKGKTKEKYCKYFEDLNAKKKRT